MPALLSAKAYPVNVKLKDGRDGPTQAPLSNLGVMVEHLVFAGNPGVSKSTLDGSEGAVGARNGDHVLQGMHKPCKHALCQRGT